MNDLVSEMADRAGFIRYNYRQRDGTEFGVYKENPEGNLIQFSELFREAIYSRVREELIPEDSIRQGPRRDQDYFTGYNAGLIDALLLIRHFGQIPD